ncbi:WYL domain-containing protein [Clostridia bacterium]|nr:WYL domain-containing protein [Clostridia bacterium]
MLPKKMLTLQVLEVLRKYTDETHKLTQAQIIEILAREHETKCDRRSVSRALLDLTDAGYKIEFDEISRTDRSGEDSPIRTNFYLSREITDGELRFLIDGVLSSRYIPKRQREDLVKKLAKLSSVHFERRNRRIVQPPTPAAPTPLLYSIAVLDEAIAMKRQVSLQYCKYGIDMKLRSRSKTSEIVNPYEIVCSNGRYYVLANYDRFDNLLHLRLDKIREIKMLETPVKPLNMVKKSGGRLDNYLTEHIYMMGGDSADVKFRISPDQMDVVVDWFGTHAQVAPQAYGDLIVSVSVNERAMIYWALQFGEVVEVLSPQSLREKIAAAARDIAEVYER